VQPARSGSRRVCPALGLRRSRGRSRPIDVCLPCIREIAVILAGVRHDQHLDEVERRGGGDKHVVGDDRADTCLRARACIRRARSGWLPLSREQQPRSAVATSKWWLLTWTTGSVAPAAGVAALPGGAGACNGRERAHAAPSEACISSGARLAAGRAGKAATWFWRSAVRRHVRGRDMTDPVRTNVPGDPRAPAGFGPWRAVAAARPSRTQQPCSMAAADESPAACSGAMLASSLLRRA